MWLWKGTLFSYIVLAFLCKDLVNLAPTHSNPVIIQKFDDVEVKADEHLRLTKSTKPIWYNIHIKALVDKNSKDFSGTVEIEIEALETTRTITLHNRDLVISSVVLSQTNGDQIQSTDNTNSENQFLTIQSSEELISGQHYKIKVEYTGKFSNGRNGIFLRHYFDNSNVQVPLATTQFEPVHARAAFVCYDEPEYKATFQMTLTHSDTLNAVSNTEGRETNNGDGTITTSFDPTPVMSTYLVAFTISDFASMKISNEPEHISHARPDAIGRTKFALENSVRTLKQLEEYFNVKFDLKKLHSVAVPEFKTAMENWGMVNYDEEYMILDEHSSHEQIVKSIRLIVHELSHNFVGNLVTTKWWDTIWLNEGFAHLFEYYISNMLMPEFNFDQQFIVDSLHNALRFDSTKKTRPMTHNVNRPEEIAALFDDIAYDKSGSVLRMMQHAIGKEIFREGLEDYIKENAHKSVQPEDLYRSLQKAIDKSSTNGITNIKEVLESWEHTQGYPVLHVTHKADTKTFGLSQEHYSSDGNQAPNSVWMIPFNFATQKHPDFSSTAPDHVIISKTAEFSAPQDFDGNKDWIIFNKQQTGYYRVNYEKENWAKLAATLNSKALGTIHVSNRAQLIDDGINLAMTGHADVDTIFELVTYLHREQHYLPWASASEYFEIMAESLSQNNPDKYETFKKFMNILVGKMYNTHQVREFKNDDIMDKYGRELAINWACAMGHEQCLTETLNHVQNNVILDTKIPNSLKSAVMCNGLRTPNRNNEWSTIFSRLLTLNDQVERNTIITALACSPDSFLLNLFVQSITLPNIPYRSLEPTFVLTSIIEHSEIGLSFVIDFLMQNNRDLLAKINLEEVIVAISNEIYSQEYFTKYMQLASLFFTTLDAQVWTKTQETIQLNMNFAKTEFYQKMLSNIEKFVDNFAEKRDPPQLDTSFRLPKTSKPSMYDIHLNIDVDQRTSEGFVAIDTEVVESTNVIVLHHRELVIEDLKVFDSQHERVEFYDFYTNSTTEFVMIEFSSNLAPKTKLRIEISYKGTVRLGGSGLYRDSYVIEGETRYLVTTQFESDWSRQCFPGYDEPLYKAKFNLAITHRNNYTAQANTMGTTVDNLDGFLTTTFEETPIMSTYLVALIVSDFEINANKPGDGETLHRVLARPNAVNKTNFGLETSVAVLKKLEEYVGLPYELPKMDSAALPSKGGAMENWGLITYGESALAYSQDLPNIPHRSLVSGTSIIAHELAHQFFGNLATTAWWDTTWLNEGFANLFQYYLIELIHPDWDFQFYNLFQMQSVFRNDDNLKSTRPMTFPVENSADISRSFDFIGYNKAGSVLRMFQFALGEKIFREGIHTYLENKKYQAAVSEDLYKGLQTAMNNNNYTAIKFDEAFKTWELQMGYPVVDATYNEVLKGFVLNQKHYLSDPKDTSSNKWTIPISYATKTNPNFDSPAAVEWFKSTAPMLTMFQRTDITKGDWYVLNIQQTGYYRVKYEKTNYERLIVALKKGEMNKIHVLNRAQLIDDAIEFVRTGLLDLDMALSLTSYLRYETSYLPFAPLEKFFNENLRALMGSPNYDSFKSYVVLLTEKLYEKLGADQKATDTVMEKYARELIVRWACRMGHKQCLDDTHKVVQDVLDKDKFVPEGMRSVVYCNGLRQAGKDEFVGMWDKMYNSKDNSERNLLISSLGCNENKDFIKEYLQSSVGGNSDVNYNQQQRNSVFNSVASNMPFSFSILIEFVLENPSDIRRAYGLSNLQSIVRSIGSYAMSEEHIKEFKDFIQNNAMKNYISPEFIEDQLKVLENNKNMVESKLIVDTVKFVKEYVENFDEDEQHGGSTEVPSTDSTVTTTTPGGPTGSTGSSDSTESSTNPGETTDDGDGGGGAATNFISSIVVIASLVIYCIIL